MRRAAALLLLALLAGCARGRGSPREAWESLRAAIAAQDGAAIGNLLDAESRAFRLRRIHEWRALLARADDPAKALADAPFSAEELRKSTDAEAAALWTARASPMLMEARWYLDAAVVEEQDERPDTARLRLRGVDGTERDLWFVREEGRWAFDQFRTRRPW